MKIPASENRRLIFREDFIMLKQISFKKIFLLVLTFLMIFNVTVYAGKPVTTTKPVISPNTLTLSTDINQRIEFSLTTTYSSQVSWTASPAGLTVVSESYNRKSKINTIKYSFVSDKSGINNFSITASVGSIVSNPAIVSITVAQPPEPTTLNYLVLGDSIAAGTDNNSIRNAIIQQINNNSSLLGLLTDINDLSANPDKYLTGYDYRYTNQFRNYLQSVTKKQVDVTDLSVPGYTTANLLAQVQLNTDYIKSANIITISIGGNDILVAGAESGFSLIDTTKFEAIGSAVSSNLDATLAFIRGINPNAKIILMNFLNLYNPNELSLGGENLNSQAESFLKSYIGNIFETMRGKYNLILADTYTLFENVNSGTTYISTQDTFAALNPLQNSPYKMETTSIFPKRFITNNSGTVKSPFLAWEAYKNEWITLANNNYDISSFTPSSDGVTIDLYTHFYNPNNYVFGHDELSSELINMIKMKYGSFAWLLWGNTVMDSIKPFEKWRDVHCTALGHSLITKAHIDAWSKATTGQ